MSVALLSTLPLTYLSMCSFGPEGAAWHLCSSSKNVEVTLLEAEDRAGGHAHTVDLQLDGQTVPVDTGYVQAATTKLLTINIRVICSILLVLFKLQYVVLVMSVVLKTFIVYQYLCRKGNSCDGERRCFVCKWKMFSIDIRARGGRFVLFVINSCIIMYASFCVDVNDQGIRNCSLHSRGLVRSINRAIE